MNTKEIREMSESEIEKSLRDTRESRLQLRMRKQTGQVGQKKGIMFHFSESAVP